MSPLLLHIFPTFVPAGPQVRTAQLINAIGRDFRHAVLSLDGQDGARELIDESIDFRMLTPLDKSGSMRTSLRLRALIKDQDPDLVMTYNWGSIDALIALRMGLSVPDLHHEDGFHPDEVAQFKRRRVMTRRALFSRAAGILVPSQALAEIATGIWRQPSRQVHLIPNGIHLERFDNSEGNPEIRRRLGIEEDAVVIGFCGHLRPEKQPLRLIEAVGQMKERPHLLFLGDGPERKSLESAIGEFGLQQRTHLLGHVEDPAPYYKAMDIFALTSDTEQMPVALLEAMASSLPVVATQVGDVVRMLPDDQENFVIPLSGMATPISLGAALDAICVGRSLRERLGKSNRARVEERYSFNVMRNAHEALWRRCTGAA